MLANMLSACAARRSHPKLILREGARLPSTRGRGAAGGHSGLRSRQQAKGRGQQRERMDKKEASEEKMDKGGLEGKVDKGGIGSRRRK